MTETGEWKSVLDLRHDWLGQLFDIKNGIRTTVYPMSSRERQKLQLELAGLKNDQSTENQYYQIT